MGFMDYFKRPAPAETKASAASSIMVMNPGQPVWTPRNYASFAKEAYSQNVIAYRAINMVAEAIASVKLMAFQGDTELTTHPLLQLLAKPNLSQGRSEYMKAKVSNLLIAGNCYEERLTVGQRIGELYVLRPDRMTLTRDAEGAVSSYTYKVNQRAKSWPVAKGRNSVMMCDVRHTKLFNPLNDDYGLSPVEAGAFGVDQFNQGMSWMQALLQNSARPSGALAMSGDSELSTDAFNRLKHQIETQYSGAQNAGRPMLLEGGLQWQQMGLSPIDMGIIEGKNSAARDVALAFGVPPMLLGIPGDNTYSNYQEARLALWEDTAIPLLQHLLEDWNSWFGQIYEGVELRANIDEIPAIVEKRRVQWEMADKATDLTIDERRELKGYPPLPGKMGETILVSSSVIPLDLAIEPPPPPPMLAPPTGDPLVPDLTEDDIKALVYGMAFTQTGERKWTSNSS